MYLTPFTINTIIVGMLLLLKESPEFDKLPKDDFLKSIKSFTNTKEGIAKVTKAPICSMDWHPSEPLIAVGDRYGEIGK